MKKAKNPCISTTVLLIIGILIQLLFLNGKGIYNINSQKYFYKINTLKDNEIYQIKYTYRIRNIKPFILENYYSSPVWAPDGKKIALTNLNFKGIYIQKIGEYSLNKITDDEGAGFRFSWSPDSKEIVFLSRKDNKIEINSTIKTVNIENGKTNDLTLGLKNVSIPSFSKKRGVIYSQDKKLLVKKDISGIDKLNKSLKLEEVIANDVPANIIIESPKEDKLIIEDDIGIKILDIKGGGRKTIIKNGVSDFACDAKFSPDGSKILYFNNVKSIGHLYVYECRTERTFDLGEGYYGQWLPDGKIIYCITTNDGYINTGSELYYINSNGTDKGQITKTIDQIEIQPAISPNGKYIVYRDEKSGKIFFGELIKLLYSGK